MIVVHVGMSRQHGSPKQVSAKDDGDEEVTPLRTKPLKMKCEIGAIGFEPTAFWSQTRRSAKLSYAPGAFRYLNRKF